MVFRFLEYQSQLRVPQRERGYPDCLLSKDGLDISLDLDNMEEMYNKIVFGGDIKISFSVQLWKIYCKKDDYYQKNYFEFLLCPNEEGDVDNPQYAEGRLSSLTLRKTII